MDPRIFHTSPSSRSSPGWGWAPTACPPPPTAPRRPSGPRPHAYLAVFLALMIAGTVLIISACYSKVIELFPGGGGGYLVATKLLGPRFGVVSGCALIFDYVLTISTSVASGVDQIFSFFPESWTATALRVQDADPRHPDPPEPARSQGKRPDPGPDLPGFPRHPLLMILGAVRQHFFADPQRLRRAHPGGAAHGRDIGWLADPLHHSAGLLPGRAARTPASRPSPTACRSCASRGSPTPSAPWLYMAVSLAFMAAGIILGVPSDRLPAAPGHES